MRGVPSLPSVPQRSTGRGSWSPELLETVPSRLTWRTQLWDESGHFQQPEPRRPPACRGWFRRAHTAGHASSVTRRRRAPYRCASRLHPACFGSTTPKPSRAKFPTRHDPDRTPSPSIPSSPSTPERSRPAAPPLGGPTPARGPSAGGPRPTPHGRGRPAAAGGGGWRGSVAACSRGGPAARPRRRPPRRRPDPPRRGRGAGTRAGPPRGPRGGIGIGAGPPPGATECPAGTRSTSGSKAPLVSSDRRAQDRSQAKPDDVVQTPVARLSGRAASHATIADAVHAAKIVLTH
jgi:hypothetical protein